VLDADGVDNQQKEEKEEEVEENLLVRLRDRLDELK